jgi:hypothetical protein
MFVTYNAWGYEGIRNKEGEIVGYRSAPRFKRSGVVKNCQNTPGLIIRQHPELAKCDKVEWTLNESL